MGGGTPAAGGHLNKHKADAEHGGRVCKHETGACGAEGWDDGGRVGARFTFHLSEGQAEPQDF